MNDGKRCIQCVSKEWDGTECSDDVSEITSVRRVRKLANDVSERGGNEAV